MRRTGDRARGPARWVVCAVLGAALLVSGTVLVFARSTPADTRRAVPVVDVGSLPAPDRTTGSRHASPPPRRPSAAHHLAAGSTLRLERLGVSAPIVGVGVTGGVMQVPLDPHRVGWWTGSAAPGDAHGTTVIVGHVNYAGVAGALGALPTLRPGDRVGITGPGQRHVFRVVALRTYAKTRGIPQSVFATGGAPRLVLITCGGPFDAATGNYEDNVVAYAVPA